MEKMILSLKNLYMMLMNEDFPIYSESVIGRAERKGQTMLRFWQSVIVEEFRSLPCGKMIWRNDGKRNRYTSYLCNRSAEIKTYSEYAKELASQIRVPAMLNQINRFADFLSTKKYKHEILIRRVRELIRLVEAEDPRVSEQIANQIRTAASAEQWQKKGAQGELFQASYLLTLLTIYAAAGEAMDSSVMTSLAKDEYSMEVLWNAYSKPLDAKKDGVQFLTIHSGLLQDNILPQHCFFGREEELFNLKEMAASNGKYLITGIGGLGKTELLRQLIRRCEEEQVVDKIAVVPYETGVVESFARCFPGFQRQNLEESFQMVLAKLEQEAEHGKVLLVIDDLTSGLEEDPELAKLLSLTCTVMITSRRSGLEGFEACSLSKTTIRTGALIFRDNYGCPLGQEDQSILSEMLTDEALCHPLTLRLMARAARNKGWSVQDLQKQLEKRNLSFTWQEEGRVERLSQIYRQLYSYIQIPEETQALAELFTILPRDNYSFKFLETYFLSIGGTKEALKEKLDVLVEGGWLDGDERGWSMHPFIAQCLRRRVITEEKISSMLQKLLNYLGQMDYISQKQYENEEFQRISNIVIYAASFVSGTMNTDFVQAILKAMCGLFISRRVCDRYLQRLDQIMKHCTEKDDVTEALHCTVKGHWHGSDAEECMAVYRKQKGRRTIPNGVFFGFCIAVGEDMMFRREYETAEILLKEALSEEAACEQKATALYNLCACSEMRGDAESFFAWTEQGAEYAKSHPECGEYLSFYLLSAACGAYVKFGQGEAAYELLQQIKPLAQKRNLPTIIAEYEQTAGAYEMYYGDLEKALAHYMRARNQVEAFWDEDPNYIQNLGQIAIILQRLKRYEEALEHYKKAIALAKQIKNAQLLHVLSNNISVVYLELERPKEALMHLADAMILAREYGGIALGEVQRNRARAYRLLKDVSQERACLEEANPLLEAAYGAEHPRAQAARERLEELMSIS